MSKAPPAQVIFPTMLWLLPWLGMLIGIKLPPVVFGAFFMMLTVLAFTGVLGKTFDMRLVACGMALMAANLLHQVVLYFHGFVDFSYTIKIAIFGCMAYAVGYALAGPATRARHLPATYIAIAAGFALVALASAMNSGFILQGEILLKTFALDIVTDMPVHKTHMGMYSSLAMCMLPALIAFGPKAAGGRWFWGVGLVSALAGFASNVATQNRTPLLAFGVSCLITYFIAAQQLRTTRWSLSRIIAWFWGAIAVSAAVASLVVLNIEHLTSTVFVAFERGSLDTPRYNVWKTMLSHYGDYFWGGRQIRLPEFFAHNFWLDALWDSGILAFIAWVCFFAVHLVFAAQLVRQRQHLITNALPLCLFLSVLLSCMAEPVAAGSVAYLLVVFTLLGSMACLSRAKT